MRLHATHPNPPHRTSLAYRAATHETLYALLSSLAGGPVIPHGTDPNPLLQLPIDPGDGFVQALLDAWAMVGDVLTFYQERIANEGFLGTATHRDSVELLARTIAYLPKPPLSAQTIFAFTMLTGRGAPLEAVIPKGTPIGAAPPADGSPAPVFETHDDVVGRGEWNAIPLAFPEPDPAALPALRAAPLTGDDLTLLRPGAPLLVRRTSHGAPSNDVVTIAAADADAAGKIALVRWAPAVAAGAPGDALQFVAFRTSMGLFGAKAQDWNGLAPAVKARYATRPGGVRRTADGSTWPEPSAGAPAGEDVLAVGFADGALLALTPQRLMLWDGAAWITLAHDASGALRSFAVAGGAIYLGGARGTVQVSRDWGGTWSRLASGLPPVSVNALTVWVVEGKAPLVVAGTNRGVAVASDEPKAAWVFRNAGLGSVGKEASPAPVVVTSLALGPRKPPPDTGRTLLGATGAGLWSMELGPATAVWAAVVTNTPKDAVFNAVAFGSLPDGRSAAFAAGTPGLFVGRDDLSVWQQWTHQEIASAPAVVAAANGRVATAAPHGVVVFDVAGNATTATSEPGRPACAVALDPDSPAVAYAEPLGAYPDEWPGFGLAGTALDLERTAPRLTAGSQVLLVDTARPELPALPARVVRTATVRLHDFGVAGLATRVELSGLEPRDLERFGRRTTRVFYDERTFEIAPDPLAPVQPVLGTSVYVDAAVTPLAPDRLVVIQGRPIRARVVGVAGGIRALSSSGACTPWAMSGLDCRRIARAPDGTIYVATTHGMWRRPAGGDSAPWGLDTLPAPPSGAAVIRAVAVGANGVVVAATTAGVYRRAPSDPGWQTTAEPKTITALAFDPDGTTLWAGGTAGLRYSTDLGASWKPVTEPGAPAGSDAFANVAALAWDGQTLLAGTSDGVAVRASGGTWQRSSDGLSNRNVIALAAGGGAWFAGTARGGVYRMRDGETSWQALPLSIPPGAQSVYALALDGTTLYAAVRGYGVLRVTDAIAAGTSSDVLDTGIANDVRDLLFAGDRILAAARSGTVLATGACDSDEITSRDLGNVDATHAPVLDQNILPAALRLDLTTRLKLPLSPKASVRRIADSKQVQFKRWLLSDDGTNDLLLRFVPDASSIVVATIRRFVVAAPPQPGAGGAQRWSFVSDDAVTGTFSADADDVEYVAANAGDPPAAEEAVVASVTPQPERGLAQLELRHALARVYDGTTTAVLGNCAYGSHGMSATTYEVVGSGDASKPNQSFVLKRPGLSMLLDPLAGAQPQPQIALVVRPSSAPGSAVASAGNLLPETTDAVGVVWKPVRTLADAAAIDPVYTVREDYRGTATLEFGDGTNGRRLPTGNENVVARYRTGNGPGGNVAAGAAAMLRRRSGGVSGASNPVPATGGLDAEPPGDVRASAARGLRSLQRIVSIGDLDDFALAWPGVEKAKLRVTGGRRKTAHLTVAGAGGADVDAALTQELLTAIGSMGGASIPVALHAPRRRYVRIGATLTVAKGADATAVEAVAVARVRAALAPARRALGEALVAARAIELLQQTAGVDSVTLTAFYDSMWSPRVAKEIVGVDDRSTIDGELLVLLDPDPAGLAVVAAAP